MAKISKKILLVIVAIFLVSLLQKVELPSQNKVSGPESDTTSSTSQANSENASYSNFLVVEYGPDNIVNYDPHISSSRLNAFTLLQKITEEQGVELETQQYDFGVFVKSINGYESGSDMAWIYFVNGESGVVAADNYELSEGDVVEWRYLEPSVSD